MGITAPGFEASTSLTEIAGHQTEIWRKGSGRTMLLLHAGDGLGPHLPLAEALAKQFDVVAPSHPGFGNSAIIPDVKTVDDLSYFYLDLMEALDLRDCLVVGLSFGGWLALEIAVKNTNRFAGLVLSAPLGFKFGPPEKREIKDLFSYPQYELEQFFYADRSKARRDYSGFPDAYLEQLARNHESFARYGWSPTLYNPKLASRLHRVKVPTLLMWGEEDQVIGRDYIEALAGRLPQAKLETIGAAGHYVHLEKREEFVAKLFAYAEKLPARPGGRI